MVSVFIDGLIPEQALVTSAMEDLTEVKEAFESVDGIEANNSGDRVLVKVMEEDSIGRFYGTARELGVSLSAVTRGHLENTVMDAWATPSDEE